SLALNDSSPVASRVRIRDPLFQFGQPVLEVDALGRSAAPPAPRPSPRGRRVGVAQDSLSRSNPEGGGSATAPPGAQSKRKQVVWPSCICVLVERNILPTRWLGYPCSHALPSGGRCTEYARKALETTDMDGMGGKCRIP